MTEFLESDSVKGKAKKMADEMIARMDVSKNGTLEFDEFIASYGKDIPAEMLEKQRASFKNIDKNGDGKLDADEIYDFCLTTVKK
jgi:Ca2+-binding EF-hand superfamily protein